MTTNEKLEIFAIFLSTSSVFLLSDMLSNNVGIGKLLLYTSAALLFQSLIRDLWILSKSRKTDELKLRRTARCMCVESATGIAGVLIGTLLLGSGIDASISMTNWSWSAVFLIALSIGFVVKDFVFEWNPWRIYRDKDHLNIIFTWR